MDYPGYRKILRMVSELHARGYQRIRFAPGMSASGCHWRCAIAPVTSISRKHGARLVVPEILVARYTSGQGRNYYDWKDAAHATPSKMADLFLKRFPEIAEAGKGPDWIYAGWYLEMLHLTYPASFPIAYADYDLPEDYLPTVGQNSSIRVPLPPPGLGKEEKEARGGKSGMSRKLKVDSRFTPCPVEDGDELFPNGIFVFNITKMTEYIMHNQIPCESVQIRDFNRGVSKFKEEHLPAVDITRPIIVAEISPGRYNVIDGNQRIEKARRLGMETIRAYRLGPVQHMQFLTTGQGY